jgi:putative hydrolase of the HAD superfamily
MIKGLLIDLGNTIVYNRDFDFNKGLKRIYDLAINPQVSYEDFIKFNEQLKPITYDNREDLEISFCHYLRYIITYFQFELTMNLEELEMEFVQACERLELIDGVKELLSFCQKKNLRVVVLSNSTFSKQALLAQIKQFDISKYFYEILSSSDYLFRKPNVNFFKLGLKTLNLNEDEVLYVGNDYYFDVEGASIANINTCWFNELGLTNNKNIDCIEVNNYLELIKYLEENYQKIKKRKEIYV